MNRGRPLPVGLRLEIKQRAADGETRRQIGAAMSLAHRTVVKYAKGIRKSSLHHGCCIAPQ